MSARSIQRAHSRRARRVVATAAVAGSALAVVPTAGEAATFNVDNLGDGFAPGTLRSAIAGANTVGGADTITFAPALTGRIELGGTLNINDPVTIDGPGAGAITVDGNDLGGVFAAYNLDPGDPVTISGLTITQGTSAIGGGIYADEADLTVEDVVITDSDAALYGGGIYVDNGSLTVRDSTITDNTVGGPGTLGEYGGGIYVSGTPGTDPVEVTITGSTIERNTSDDAGGGVYIAYAESDVVVRNSEFIGNIAQDSGGGLRVTNDSAGNKVTIDSTLMADNISYGAGGGASLDASEAVAISNSTIAGNTADYGGGIDNSSVATVPVTITGSSIFDNEATYGGGGVWENAPPNGVVRITSSIVSGNTAGSEGGPDLLDDDGSFSVGNSLIGNVSGLATPLVQTPAGTNKIGVDPQLGPVQDNGGPTRTAAPALTSPAVDAGVAGGLTTDARGLARTVIQPTVPLSAGSDGTDIGAVELAAVAGPPTQPVDTKVDGVKVDAKPTQKQKGRKVVITVQAGAAEAVSVEASGSVKVGKEKILLKTVTAKAKAGEQATLKLSPTSRRGSRMILNALLTPSSKGGKRTVPKIFVTLTDGATNSVTVKPKVKLK